jgi:hypothetical protein
MAGRALHLPDLPLGHCSGHRHCPATARVSWSFPATGVDTSGIAFFFREWCFSDFSYSS